MVSRNTVILSCALLFATGCADSTPTPPAEVKKPQEPGKVTEFDPNSGAVEVDHKQKITDPITGPLAALQNAKIDIPQLAIQHALDLFNAAEGRYPNSFEEFMTRVIKENQIRLPQLPQGMEFQYDVENHKLLIVKSQAAPASTEQK
ncbi:MAG: hypothetical protein JNM43_20670 [Planctomycetaceae bacterium]|nr:hypothetical protein [Planctomycetaceae bacterium]